MSFPKNFWWGAATAAYQVEGAVNKDGRGRTVWDLFCERPGAVWSGHSGAVASDHYHHWREDVGWMRQLGLLAYRFSIAWTRVLPEGTGRVNAKGLAFYDRLVDALLAANIQPFITLFHWDYPLELYYRGGWLNRDSAEWFADYATVVAKKLGDRVRYWLTLNEPQCYITFGHQEGIHAPGLKLGWTEVLRAVHHTLLAHGRGVQALRAHCRTKPQIGWASVSLVKMPASSRAADIRAAREATFAVRPGNLWNNTWWMDPIYLGRYPADGLKAYAPHEPPVRDGDLKVISSPLDFFAFNIYNGEFVRAGQSESVRWPEGHPLTLFYWPVTPSCLYWAVRFFAERYRLPIIITENGMSCIDWVAEDGRVHDPQRIDFTRRYLRELRRAMAEGVDVRGYFHWTLLDNFEWAEGYRQRFGLIHVDYPSGRRTPKDSFYWYQRVIATNGASLDDVPVGFSA